MTTGSNATTRGTAAQAPAGPPPTTSVEEGYAYFRGEDPRHHD